MGRTWFARSVGHLFAGALLAGGVAVWGPATGASADPYGTVRVTYAGSHSSYQVNPGIQHDYSWDHDLLLTTPLQAGYGFRQSGTGALQASNWAELTGSFRFDHVTTEMGDEGPCVYREREAWSGTIDADPLDGDGAPLVVTGRLDPDDPIGLRVNFTLPLTWSKVLLSGTGCGNGAFSQPATYEFTVDAVATPTSTGSGNERISGVFEATVHNLLSYPVVAVPSVEADLWSECLDIEPALSPSVCLPRGSVTIVHDSDLDHPQDFSYALQGLGPVSVVLDDDPASLGTPSSQTFTNLNPGSYSFSQDPSLPAGWASPTLACEDDVVPDVQSVNGRTLYEVTLLPSEQVTCTFRNRSVRPDAQIGVSGVGSPVGNNVYASAVLPSQTKGSTVTRTGTRTFVLRMQNDGPLQDFYKVRLAQSGAAGFGVRVLDQLNHDVTTMVRAGTFQTQVNGGQTADLRVQVTGRTAARNAVRRFDFTVSSTRQASFKDVVRAQVTRT